MAATESAILILGFIFWDADAFASSTSKAGCLSDQVNCRIDADGREREGNMETDEGRKVAMLFAGVVWLALGLRGFDRLDVAGIGDTQRAARLSRTRARRASPFVPG